MNEVGLPKNVTLATKVIEAQHTSKRMDLGVMGRIFGGGAEKHGNIAVVVLLLCFVALAYVAHMVPELLREHARDVVSGIMGIMSLVIGYIFGRKSSD